MHLTFSESFETIEAIVQKILADQEILFLKIDHFLVKGGNFFLKNLIFFQLQVQLLQNVLKMFMPLLKLKNRDSPFLPPIFDPFWPFLDLRI